VALRGLRLRAQGGPDRGGVMGFWHWLIHWTGCDYGLQYGKWSFYGFWSGFGSDIAEVTIIAGLVAVYRKHNCGVRWCPRIARHNFTDPDSGIVHQLCRRHHPGHGGRPVTAQQVREKYRLYLGKNPGRG
jgi:hypothetical protein